MLGVREKTPEEWEDYYREEERKYQAQQAHLKEEYEKGRRDIYKKACPICGTVFYTYNPRKIYDDYYKCSRYQHRQNAKDARCRARRTVCAECGKYFTPERAGAKYCCPACKQRAYRSRKKQRDEVHPTE